MTKRKLKAALELREGEVRLIREMHSQACANLDRERESRIRQIFADKKEDILAKVLTSMEKIDKSEFYTAGMYNGLEYSRSLLIGDDPEYFFLGDTKRVTLTSNNRIYPGCDKCKEEVGADDRYCSHCGAKLECISEEPEEPCEACKIKGVVCHNTKISAEDLQNGM